MELVLLREIFEMEREATKEGGLWTSHPGWNLTFDLIESSRTSTRSSWQPVYLQTPVLSLVAQSCLTLCDPMEATWGFSRQELEWVSMPSSRGSSPPRDRTQVSCTAGRFFTI